MENSLYSARMMYTGEDATVVSELVSSYAWDTALNFICQTNEEGYLLATTKDSTYGNIETGIDVSNRTNTGEYEADCYSNIYDMLGNCTEWTTEYCSGSNNNVLRGGTYQTGSLNTSERAEAYDTEAYEFFGFRVQLYVK